MSKRADTWMPLYIADYLRDTMHLSAEQHGAYLLLLMACWSRGGSLPDNDAQLAGIARMPLAAWRRNAPIIRAFFDSEGGALVQGRVSAEIDRAKRITEVRREAGAKGGRPGAQNESKPKPKAFANGQQTETPSQKTVTVSEPTGSSTSEPNGSEPGGLVIDFDRDAWTGAVTVLRSRGDASEKGARSFFGKLLSENGLEARDLLPAIASAQVNGTADPQGYLRKAAQGISKRRADSRPRRQAYV
jgi:uncharacterized protein YdaU (DUF1376 family)